MAKVTVIIDGDERPLKKSVDAAVRELSRLEKAVERQKNPYETNKLSPQFNTLSRQQFQEVQRIARERARLHEIEARKEAALAVQTSRARTQAENNYFRAAEAQRRRDFSEYQRIERQKTAIANAENRKRQSFTQFARSAGGGLQQGGGALQTGGATLTATLTAPLVTIATLGIKTALELDAARTKLAALEGDSVKAAKRMEQLFALADRSVGVTRAAALETFTQLKGIGGIAENTVNDLIGTIGKLNAAFNLEDQQGFIRNLVQIFSQGFERSDIKEAIGRIPIFEQLLESAFGTKDGAKLKALKESGKLTLDAFLQGLIGAVNTDQRLANVSESLTVKLAKGFERLNQALAPLGDVILQAVIPVFERITPFVQQAADYFKTLSPAVQQSVVAFGALLAVAGPILVILGSLIVAIGGLISGATAIIGVFTSVGVAVGAAAGSFAAFAAGVGTVGLVIAGLAVVFAPAIAAAAEFYLVWTTNFGGVRTFILQVIGVLQKAYAAFITEFRALTEQATTEAAQFWQENGADIMNAVQTATELIESVVRAFIGVVGALWRENGEEIKAIVSAAWTVVKTVTIAGVRIVLNTIKLVSAVINGDWAKAWDALKNIVSSALTAAGALIAAQAIVIINIIKGIATSIYSTAVEIGKNLIQGLINGILSGRGTLYETAKSIITNAINIFRSVPQVESPSKVTTKIGEDITEGLAIGIENKNKRVVSAARRVASEVIKELREAVKEFNRFAGASPESVQTIQQTNRIRDAAQSQQEIIGLRKELGVNQFRPLPSTVTGTEDEVNALRRQKEQAEELNKTYDKLRDNVTKMQEAEAQFNEDVQKRMEAMRASGELALLDLAEQIDLEGVLDEHQRRQIENLYEIERLRIELSSDGWGETLVKEALEIAKANQQAREEMERILFVRKQVSGAESLGKDLQKELEFLQRGGRELTEYERVLQKINTDYKDISDSQKEYLLNMAAQVDAQRKFNEQYEETFNFIRDAFDILTDESQSFGDRIKNVFKSIADRFKQMVLDMAASWLTNKIFGQGSGGFNLGGLFGGGGGFGGTPNFNPNTQGGGGFLNQLFGLVSGGRGSSGQLPIGIFSGSQIRQTAGLEARQGGFLSAIFGRGGIFGDKGFGFNAGTVTGIGALASIAGGLLPGRAGGILSGVGSGIGIGATIGSIIPGLGTLVGGLIGGAVGFFASLFGDPKRKRDKNEKLPALQQGFADALKALRELAANKRAIQNDPQGAITQADTLRGQIASGFGITFESSKYRKQAQQMIQARLAEADVLIKQIKEFAKRAEAASLRPILPEFADGGLVSKFIRQNGMHNQFSGLVPGVYDRRDDKLIRVSGREVVLTPDVWQPITPYLREKKVPGFANGGLVGTAAPSYSPTIEVNPNFNITLIEREDGNLDAYLDTERGRKKIKVAFQRLKKDREI